MRGRKPKPTPLKVLAGNPGQRRLPAAEPKPEAGSWEAPAWLDGEALAEFNRLVPILRRAWMLSGADYQSVVMYCLAVAAIIDAKKAGKAINASMLGQFRSLAAELGCTPSSRSRVTAIKPPPDDDEAFFRDLG